MTTPSIVKVTQYFSKVTLTPITSTPLHDSIKNPQTELNTNTMSVPSDNTPFGHLVLTMTPVDYLQKTPDLFDSPHNPGTGPTIALGATAPTITQAHWTFQVKKRYTTYTTQQTKP